MCGLGFPFLSLGFRGQFPGDGLPEFAGREVVAPHQVHLYSMVLIVSGMAFLLSVLLCVLFRHLFPFVIHLLKTVHIIFTDYMNLG